MQGRPSWFRRPAPDQASLLRMRDLMREQRLNTVCVEAHCPNQGECFQRGTATFLILGDLCTRGCRFCAVKQGRPRPLDPDEPARVAETVRLLGLKHVVITSVTRDDLPDQGAGQFASTIRAVKQTSPGASVEVLVPDFQGSRQALEQVARAGPEVIAHNLETVPALYPQVRPGADYRRSLELLARLRRLAPEAVSKSGMILGLGESTAQVLAVLRDLRLAGCQVLTLGQYLAPSRRHVSVREFIPPAVFDELRQRALEMGFSYVAASPYVRSSYRAAEALQAVRSSQG